MNRANRILVCTVLVILAKICITSATCSDTVMSQMQNIFVQNFTQNRALAPLCLRGAFHDCWNGCNGALLLPEEISRSENVGLEPLKTYLDPFLNQFTCVSVADLINSCAVTAVKFLGGPDVPVTFGRVDTGVPDPNGLLPAGTLSVQELISAFEPIGFDSTEIVTLSGAHCVGVCEGQPFCPGQNTTFGNHYYVQLLNGEFEGKLQTDMDLLQDSTMKSVVQQYAADQQQFFDDFAKTLGKYISRIQCNQTSNGPCPLDSSSTSSQPSTNNNSPQQPSESAPTSTASSNPEEFPPFGLPNFDGPTSLSSQGQSSNPSSGASSGNFFPVFI
ncbi:L-ascorbate peroxidase 2, cytosolic [Galdieria sulphuraria]|nr:L-ascorbate peroxidase 2, cytosolic [Galdieria sulphuraria]